MIEARKISELPETKIMKDSSCMPIVQDGETRKIYFADLKWLFKGDKGDPGKKGDKGDTGVSIDRITVEESDVDEGENKIIILKDNGQAATFIIRNGSKGVAMRNRGTWESGVDYVNDVTYLDIVYYPETGCSYVCNTSHTSGDILPTDTNYWTLLATKGDKGDKGDKGEKGDTGAVATVVQNTGDSLDNVMSQKAVTEALGTKAPESHSHVKQDITDFAHNHDDRYYTENEIDTKVNQLKSDLINQLYPVGAIYISLKDECSPANFIPTSQWEKLPEGKALWTTSSGAGVTIDAGLPNITGYDAIGIAGNNFGLKANLSMSGAFNAGKDVYKSSLPEYQLRDIESLGLVSGYTGKLGVGFDASKSNPIYGNSTTVQPPAYKVYAWKRIA